MSHVFLYVYQVSNITYLSSLIHYSFSFGGTGRRAFLVLKFFMLYTFVSLHSTCISYSQKCVSAFHAAVSTSYLPVLYVYTLCLCQCISHDSSVHANV